MHRRVTSSRTARCLVVVASGTLVASCSSSAGNQAPRATTSTAPVRAVASTTTSSIVPTTVAAPPPTTTTTAPPPPTYSGFEATITSWNTGHSQDANYQGFPAYGPTVSTPEGPTPQYISVQNDGARIDQFTEVLSNGTSLSAAEQAVREDLPSDVVAVSLDISDQNGSCAFWNLQSSTLGGLDNAHVVIEMAYDDSNGSPRWVPGNVNTLTFEEGANDSTGTC